MHPAFAAVPLLYLSVLVPIKETLDSFVEMCIRDRSVIGLADVLDCTESDILRAFKY